MVLYLTNDANPLSVSFLHSMMATTKKKHQIGEAKQKG